MQLKKKEINKFFIFFLLAHLFIWTLIPSVSNINLPLDTIEALGWSNNLQLGYDKYPPIFPLFVELFYLIFGSQDWAYYFLSQIFVTISFIIIFKISNNFFENKIYSLLSVLLLEGVYFYNFTTPELNAFLCQFPFLSATVFYCWKSIKTNDSNSWFIFGIFAALAALTYYLSFYLLAAIGLFFIYVIFKEKKFNNKYLIALISFIIVISPHFFWIADNNFISIRYAFFRSFQDPLTEVSNFQFLDHIYYPLIFLVKQIGLMIPVFIMLFFLLNNFKVKINFKDKKLMFLFFIAVVPIILMFLTSLVAGIRIRTMWMTSFYLFIGVFLVYLFEAKINLKKFKNFFLSFVFLFIFSPILYCVVSYTQIDKRTDYPGKKISLIVQEKWNSNFLNKIEVVAGDGWVNGGWYAGNLSYHLESRPKLEKKLLYRPNIGTVWIKGFGEIADCKGVFYQIEPFNDICMFGQKQK